MAASGSAGVEKKRKSPEVSASVKKYLEEFYMKEDDVYFVLKKELYGESAAGVWKDKEYFLSVELFEAFKAELKTASIVQDAEGPSDLVRTTLEAHTIEVQSLTESMEELKNQVEVMTRVNTGLSRTNTILTSRVEALETRNTDLNKRLKVVEELGGAFGVLYPSRDEVERMIKK